MIFCAAWHFAFVEAGQLAIKIIWQLPSESIYRGGVFERLAQKNGRMHETANTYGGAFR